MKYLEMVKNGQAMLAIIEEAVGNGFRVLSANGGSVTVKAGCLPIEISYEMCLCHGGRLWLNQENTGIHIELSSDTYDEDKGIVDAETELAWRIENEMAYTVKSFERYVYVVEEIGKYRKDEHSVKYFKSSEDASNYIFEENGHDINAEYGTVRHKCPNPEIYYEYTYDGEENGRIRFIGRRFCKKNGEFKKDKEWPIEYHVFRKDRG